MVKFFLEYEDRPIMQISTTKLSTQNFSKPAAPAPRAETSEASMPSDSFSFSRAGGGHYSGGKVLVRAASGALTGLLVNKFSDGSTWGAAKLGAGVNGVIGAGVGAVGGAIAGGVAGAPLAGAAVGAATFGIPMAIGGGVKGALVGVVGNALGGGAVAFAGAGAILGAVGL